MTKAARASHKQQHQDQNIDKGSKSITQTTTPKLKQWPQQQEYCKNNNNNIKAMTKSARVAH